MRLTCGVEFIKKDFWVTDKKTETQTKYFVLIYCSLKNF